MPLQSVGETAKQIGARPVDITGLFYRGLLRDDICPLIGGRRVIPSDYVETIRAALRRAGKPVSKPVQEVTSAK
jgi:hypothetical protein